MTKNRIKLRAPPWNKSVFKHGTIVIVQVEEWKYADLVYENLVSLNGNEPFPGQARLLNQKVFVSAPGYICDETSHKKLFLIISILEIVHIGKNVDYAIYVTDRGLVYIDAEALEENSFVVLQ